MCVNCSLWRIRFIGHNGEAIQRPECDRVICSTHSARSLNAVCRKHFRCHRRPRPVPMCSLLTNNVNFSSLVRGFHGPNCTHGKAGTVHFKSQHSAGAKELLCQRARRRPLYISVQSTNASVHNKWIAREQLNARFS
jgi:hypothetical protein